MQGLKELLDNLAELGVTMQSAGRGAALAVANDIKTLAIQNARAQGLVASGAMVDNIAVKFQSGNPKGLYEYHVGVRHGPEAKGGQKLAVRDSAGHIRYVYENDPFYWWMWEHGHFNIFFRHYVAAKPFMRPAFDAVAPGALDRIKTYLLDRTNKAIKHELRGIS